MFHRSRGGVGPICHPTARGRPEPTAMPPRPIGIDRPTIGIERPPTDQASADASTIRPHQNRVGSRLPDPLKIDAVRTRGRFSWGRLSPDHLPPLVLLPADRAPSETGSRIAAPLSPAGPRRSGPAGLSSPASIPHRWPRPIGIERNTRAREEVRRIGPRVLLSLPAAPRRDEDPRAHFPR